MAVAFDSPAAVAAVPLGACDDGAGVLDCADCTVDAVVGAAGAAFVFCLLYSSVVASWGSNAAGGSTAHPVTIGRRVSTVRTKGSRSGACSLIVNLNDPHGPVPPESGPVRPASAAAVGTVSSLGEASPKRPSRGRDVAGVSSSAGDAVPRRARVVALLRVPCSGLPATITALGISPSLTAAADGCGS